ncbi:MAG: hypothetical protein KIT17_01390 [Rubrivivax sp.]|nr:hypothetical protein [Rubrivivax sp.]
MLLFWLFALASSWANACVLQERQTHAHSSASVDEPTVVTVSAGHVGAVPGHFDGATATGETVCLEVCDATTQTCMQPDWVIDLPDLVLGPPASLAWAPQVRPPLSGPGTTAAPSPRAAVPPRTLFSRLAL